MLVMSLIPHFSFSTYIIFRFLHFCHKVISLLKNTACAMTCGIWDEGLWLILDKSSFPGCLKLLTDGPLPPTSFCAPRAVSVTKPQVQIPLSSKIQRSIFNLGKYYQRWADIPLCRYPDCVLLLFYSDSYLLPGKKKL